MSWALCKLRHWRGKWAQITMAGCLTAATMSPAAPLPCSWGQGNVPCSSAPGQQAARTCACLQSTSTPQPGISPMLQAAFLRAVAFLSAAAPRGCLGRGAAGTPATCDAPPLHDSRHLRGIPMYSDGAFREGRISSSRQRKGGDVRGWHSLAGMQAGKCARVASLHPSQAAGL